MRIDLLKVVIVCQLFARHDPTKASEECHSWFSANRHLPHLAVGLTGVVDKACDSTSGGIDNHLVVKTHQIVALIYVSSPSESDANVSSHLIFLVDLLHTSFALGLCDNLAGIFDDDLKGLKSSHCANSIPTAFGLHNLDSIIIAVTFTTSF